MTTRTRADTLLALSPARRSSARPRGLCAESAPLVQPYLTPIASCPIHPRSASPAPGIAVIGSTARVNTTSAKAGLRPSFPAGRGATPPKPTISPPPAPTPKKVRCRGRHPRRLVSQRPPSSTQPRLPLHSALLRIPPTPPHASPPHHATAPPPSAHAHPTLQPAAAKAGAFAILRPGARPRARGRGDRAGGRRGRHRLRRPGQAHPPQALRAVQPPAGAGGSERYMTVT